MFRLEIFSWCILYTSQCNKLVESDELAHLVEDSASLEDAEAQSSYLALVQLVRSFPLALSFEKVANHSLARHSKVEE